MKLTKLLILTALNIVVQTVAAQDILFKTNGTKDTVIVQRVTSTQIMFKKFNKPNGSDFILNKNTVERIEFANGKVLIIDDKAQFDINNRYDWEENLGMNIISTNIFNLFGGNVSLSYERILADGMFGIKVNTNFHCIDINLLKYKRLYTIGIDFNYYPNWQDRLCYFFGTSIRFGQWSEKRNIGSTVKEDKYSSFSTFINNGVCFHYNKNFYTCINGGVGFTNLIPKDLLIPSGPAPKIFFDGILGLSVGYRF